MHLVRKRIFVGNLPSRLSRSDVEEKLREFGNVLSVELKQRTDNEGNILSSFAFVDIETDLEKLDSCFQRFETQLWCNHKIKLELAKESFLDRLKREQNAAKSQTISTSIGNNSSHITEQTNSFERIADCNNDKGSIPCSEKRHSLILKGAKSHPDTVEKVIKRNNRKTERTCMNSIQTDEQKTRDSDDSIERRVENKEREDVQILCDEESDKETCKRYGSLPMFSGTKNLKDLGDSCVRINPPSPREKRNIQNLSCPAKSPNCRHDSFSSDKIATEIKNENTIYSRPVEPPYVFGKNLGHSEERIRKKPENDRIAEEKRLNALDERNKALSLQKEAVKKALSSVDSNTTINKKIVFDLDEDDEDPANLQADKHFLHDSNAEARKHKLFEDSSDDEDLKDWKKEEFKIKPQFEGPKGQKLLQIQSRYGNDSRFNLDERFQESEDEMECSQEERDEEDFNAEKQHQLSILQEILGVDVSTRTTKKDKVDNRNHIDMVRFDPSNPDHSKYIVKEDDAEAKKKVAERDEGVKGKKRKREVEEKGEEEEEKPVPTSTERFYVVSDLLKESLKKRNERNDTVKADGSSESAKGFSLLKTFGSAPSDNDEEEEIESYASHPIKKGLHDWDKNPFKYDSSDDEEDNIKKTDDSGETSLNNSANTSKLKNENEKSSTGLTEKFHFKDEDPRLQEGLAFFMVEKSFEEMQEGFQEKRADLKLIIKAKVRNNKRKKQPFRRKLGGLRRNQRNLSSKARN